MVLLLNWRNTIKFRADTDLKGLVGRGIDYDDEFRKQRIVSPKFSQERLPVSSNQVEKFWPSCYTGTFTTTFSQSTMRRKRNRRFSGKKVQLNCSNAFAFVSEKHMTVNLNHTFSF